MDTRVPSRPIGITFCEGGEQFRQDGFRGFEFVWVERGFGVSVSESGWGCSFVDEGFWSFAVGGLHGVASVRGFGRRGDGGLP